MNNNVPYVTRTLLLSNYVIYLAGGKIKDKKYKWSSVLHLKPFSSKSWTFSSISAISVDYSREQRYYLLKTYCGKNGRNGAGPKTREQIEVRIRPTITKNVGGT